MLHLLGKIWSLTSNYAIYSIVIVVAGDTDETKFHIRNRDIAITPAIGTSTGVRGLSGDDGLSSNDKDIYGEIIKIMQKRDTISYLAESYTDSRSYIKSFLEKGTSSTKPIPIILR